MEGDQRKSSLWRLIELGFLFFFSAIALTYTLYFPLYSIFVLLWTLYFYLSSSTKTNNESTKKKEEEEEEYYKILKILDNNDSRYPDLINKLKKFSNHDQTDKSIPNTTESSYQTSNESLYILLDTICKEAKKEKNDNPQQLLSKKDKTEEKAKEGKEIEEEEEEAEGEEEEEEAEEEEEEEKCEFNFDGWLIEYIVKVLPPGTEEEFKYYVQKKTDEIINKCESVEKGFRSHFELIIKSKPRYNNNSYNQKHEQTFDKDEDYYPNNFKGKSLKFEDYSVINKTSGKPSNSYIKKEYLWDLIRGNADHFITFDYSCWYHKDDKKPFWLIPFSLYRWWTPENDSFIGKFISFLNLDLHENTKENMLHDILFYFLLAYAKKVKRISQNYEIAGISTMINNKFEAYCLIGFLKAEDIIKVDKFVYDDIVSQCINYLIEQKKFSWPLSAFTLNKEKDRDRLKKLLESYCDFSTELSKEEEIAINTYDKDEKKFKIDEKDVYNVKGEKFISKAIHEFNRNDFHQTFKDGISCLLKAENYSRILQLLTDYYLKLMSEVGNVTYFNDIFNDVKDAIREKIKPKNDINRPNNEEEENILIIEYVKRELTNNEDYDILDIVDKCLKRKINQNDFIRATQILSSKPYNIRRFVLSLLIKQDGWEDFLKDPNSLEPFINTGAIPADQILYYQYINDLNSINQLLIQTDSS